MSQYVIVSGVGIPNNGIMFPSGTIPYTDPGSQLCALLASVNASFGFNLEPHKFSTEWIPKGDPCSFHGASGQLPNIGTRLEFYVGDFLVRGLVSHADYISSDAGTIINLNIEDERKYLRRVKVHTEDLGENAPSGVVSIARAYRVINGLLDVFGDPSDPLIREYDRITQYGGTYSQFLQAIDLHFNEGRISIPVTDLPTLAQIEQNVGGSADFIRFQFSMTTLDEAISKVLADFGYDWYFGLDSYKIHLINKKYPFDISEADILNIVSTFGSLSGLNETKQTSFGHDVVPDPTRLRIIGGHQEGVINSALLSPIDGLDTSAIDGNVTFTKVWDKLSVGFYDANGFYRTYVPSDTELQIALAGIEQWTYFKKYQTILPSVAGTPGFGLASDAGFIAGQHPTFQSRLDPMMPFSAAGTGSAQSGIRIISNRRDEEHNWVIEFYNRVRDHAARHYGRSYIAEGILYNQASGLYRLVDSAWANVDNQVQGYPLSASGVIQASGVFIDDYEINRRLGPISPFVTDDFKVTAHCILPANTVYGPQGDDVPASFGNWTEDAPPFNPTGDGRHYIPVELKVVGQRVINPRSDDLYSFESFPEGTLWCQLPNIAGLKTNLTSNGTLSNLATLITTRNKISASGITDIIDPSIVLTPFDTLTTVAIPVEARSRYGQAYPSQWVIGNFHYERDEDIEIDDQYVPWAFSPEGNQNSLQLLNDAAIRRIAGAIVPRSSSRYADFTQVGLPRISFDAFANQSIGPSGLFGEISHGVNELNISFGEDGFTTRYKIQSYFPKFGQDAPLGERRRGILNGILNPIDYTSFALQRRGGVASSNPFLPGEEIPTPIFFDQEQRAVVVTITDVNNVYELGDPPTLDEERYFGLDSQLYEKPPRVSSSNPDFTEGAICIDGFLNIGDKAVYHTDSFELPNGHLIFRYFTQGRPFSNSTIVEVRQANGSNYDVTIVDPTASANGIERAIANVPVLNGTVSIGDKTTLAAQGDCVVKPGFASDGVFLNPTANAGAGVIPAQIISLENMGSTYATAVVQVLNSSGIVEPTGDMYSGVVPIPYRQYSVIGDIGFLAPSVQVPIAGNPSSVSGVNFFFQVKQTFTRFTS